MVKVKRLNNANPKMSLARRTLDANVYRGLVLTIELTFHDDIVLGIHEVE